MPVRFSGRGPWSQAGVRGPVAVARRPGAPGRRREGGRAAAANARRACDSRPTSRSASPRTRSKSRPGSEAARSRTAGASAGASRRTTDSRMAAPARSPAARAARAAASSAPGSGIGSTSLPAGPASIRTATPVPTIAAPATVAGASPTAAAPTVRAAGAAGSAAPGAADAARATAAPAADGTRWAGVVGQTSLRGMPAKTGSIGPSTSSSARRGQPARLARAAERGRRLGGDDERDDGHAAARDVGGRGLPGAGQVAGPPADLGQVEERLVVERPAPASASSSARARP